MSSFPSWLHHLFPASYAWLPGRSLGFCGVPSSTRRPPSWALRSRAFWLWWCQRGCPRFVLLRLCLCLSSLLGIFCRPWLARCPCLCAYLLACGSVPFAWFDGAFECSGAPHLPISLHEIMAPLAHRPSFNHIHFVQVHQWPSCLLIFHTWNGADTSVPVAAFEV